MRGRRPKENPGPMLKLPSVPADVKKDRVAHKEWNRLIGKLSGVDERDRALLAAHCLAWSQMLQAKAELKDGLTITLLNGCLVAHPAVAIMHAAMKAIERTAAKLGLSPFSRGQILTNATKPKTSEWEGLLAEGHDEVRIADVG